MSDVNFGIYKKNNHPQKIRQIAIVNVALVRNHCILTNFHVFICKYKIHSSPTKITFFAQIKYNERILDVKYKIFLNVFYVSIFQQCQMYRAPKMLQEKSI